jgi:hypothetical protein
MTAAARKPDDVIGTILTPIASTFGFNIAEAWRNPRQVWDLVVLHAPGLTVAARTWPKQLCKPHDFFLRSAQRGGDPSELSGLFNKVTWYFFGHEEDGEILDWLLIDHRRSAPSFATTSTGLGASLTRYWIFPSAFWSARAQIF